MVKRELLLWHFYIQRLRKLSRLLSVILCSGDAKRSTPHRASPELGVPARGRWGRAAGRVPALGVGITRGRAAPPAAGRHLRASRAPSGSASELGQTYISVRHFRRRIRGRERARERDGCVLERRILVHGLEQFGYESMSAHLQVARRLGASPRARWDVFGVRSRSAPCARRRRRTGSGARPSPRSEVSTTTARSTRLARPGKRLPSGGFEDARREPLAAPGHVERKPVSEVTNLLRSVD